MTDYRKLFPSEYLRPVDMLGLGDVPVTIAGIKTELVKSFREGSDQEDVCVVMSIVGTDKRLILNRTNADTIASIYGNDIEAWAGKRVTLFIQGGVKAFGKVWDAIRIRPKPPARQAKSSGERLQEAPRGPEAPEDVQARVDRETAGLDAQAATAALYGPDPDAAGKKELVQAEFDAEDLAAAHEPPAGEPERGPNDQDVLLV
jgi:hypothetical protein